MSGNCRDQLLDFCERNSCLFWDSSCSTVQGLCNTFHFIMVQMFSVGERPGLQAGQFNTQIFPQSHTIVIKKILHLEGSICCSKSSKIYLSAQLGPYKAYKLPISCIHIPSVMHSMLHFVLNVGHCLALDI